MRALTVDCLYSVPPSLRQIILPTVSRLSIVVASAQGSLIVLGSTQILSAAPAADVISQSALATCSIALRRCQFPFGTVPGVF